MECAKTRSQMAIEYGIHRKTFSRWLKKAGIVVDGYLIPPKAQEMIYQLFGDPRKKGSSIA